MTWWGIIGSQGQTVKNSRVRSEKKIIKCPRRVCWATAREKNNNWSWTPDLLFITDFEMHWLYFLFIIIRWIRHAAEVIKNCVRLTFVCITPSAMMILWMIWGGTEAVCFTQIVLASVCPKLGLPCAHVHIMHAGPLKASLFYTDRRTRKRIHELTRGRLILIKSKWETERCQGFGIKCADAVIFALYLIYAVSDDPTPSFPLAFWIGNSIKR